MNAFKTSALLAALVSTPLLTPTAMAANVQDDIKALQEQNKMMMERLDATMDMMDKKGSTHGAKGKTTLGGYGELHLNSLTGEGGATSLNEIDFHRFVLFVGHEFSDDIRFFSELELEHSIAGDSQKGEIELEQGYIEFDISKTTQAKGGLFLVPVGIINETHEPNVFYGTERNPVEKNIIPATWWEGGAALSGELKAGLSYDVALTSGLDLSTSNKVRDGRTKVAKARTNSPMITGRLKYTGIPGLEVAATMLSISDYTQGQGTKNAATMIETHAVYSSGAFGLRALYASWNVNGKTSGYDKQSGWYIEPSYKISPKIGVFARYNKYDNQAGTAGTGNTSKQQTDIGMNYWPHEDVVIKVDFQTQDNANGKNQNGINMGIGYQF